MIFDEHLETVDDLQVNNLQIIQKINGFRFGIDAVLLANFASFKKNDLIVDFCAGSGIVPILLVGKRNAKQAIGVEIQEEYAEMSTRSVKMNSLEQRIQIIHGDLKDSSLITCESCDVVTCNPPYKEMEGGLVNPLDSLAIARHEIMCNMDDIISSAARILRFGGKFSMIHRPERLPEIFETMRKYKIEPKKACMVYPSADKAPTMVLIEGMKGARPKLLWQPPIFVHDNDGQYTQQINEIYGRNS